MEGKSLAPASTMHGTHHARKTTGNAKAWLPLFVSIFALILVFFSGLGLAGEGPLSFLASQPETVPTTDSAADTNTDPGGGETPAEPPGEDSRDKESPAPNDKLPPADPEPPEPPADPFAGRGDRVRGIYLTGPTAGNPARLNELLILARDGGLNAMVIDVKNDDGRLTYRSEVPLANEIGADGNYITNLPDLVTYLKENDIYPIARVVVFCDPLLSSRRTEYAIKVNESVWRDGRGFSWTNPYLREVWDYNIAIALEAARAGFLEIQFDYVRFPEKGVPGVTQGVPIEERTAAINGFLGYAKERLSELDVTISADVFGLTTTVTDDMLIGQDYAAIASVVDYISPMVYPSHYSPGNYGLANPDASPYETVHNTMLKALEKTPDLPATRHRPWIQDFTLRHRYGKTEVEAQLRALADTGIHQFLLWNSTNRYTPGVDYNLIGRPPPGEDESVSTEPKAPPAESESSSAGDPGAEGLPPPNELGEIMVIEYHHIGSREERWTRTPANFRRDLETLYEKGYRPVNMADAVSGSIDLPRGYSPVVITFDDSSPGQFRYLEDEGGRKIDPKSAVGILLAFHEEHPDWPLKASFYVNDRPFGDVATWKEKIRQLHEFGMEVGNHTLSHADLGRLTPAQTTREVGGLNKLIVDLLPQTAPTTLALPNGTHPQSPEAAKSGTYQGVNYETRAFLLVGAGPAPSPFNVRFDPYRIPRIQAVDSAIEARLNLAFWLDVFDRQPERRYVSDGDPERITAPAELLPEISPDWRSLTPTVR